MDRDARNLRAWRNRSNWIGPRWLGLYHAKDDDRIWVPKWPKVLGWTVNLARTGGLGILAGLSVTVGLIVAAQLVRALQVGPG